MKKQALLVFAMLAVTAVIGVGTGFGECLSGEARIPFDFRVAGKTLPAGTYSLQPIAAQACLVQSDDGGQHVITLMRTTAETKDTGAKWVFHRYGNRYFLAKIVVNGTATELPQSKLEREMARLGTNLEYAYVPFQRN